jgi:alpha-beta hydrolase superfamily lysophospholipase
MNASHRFILLATALAISGCALPNTTPAPPNGYQTGPARSGEGGPRWKAEDGLAIAYRHWPAQGKVRGVIAASPGWDSDALDWTPTASGLAARGYEVYVLGRRTQWGDPRVYLGTDMGQARRGNLSDWRQWAKDYAGFTRWVAARHPGRPLIYGAQSLGSNEVLTVAGDPVWRGAPARGVFLITPSLSHMYPSAKMSFLNAVGPVFFKQDYRMADVQGMHHDGKRIMNNLAEWTRWSNSKDRVYEGYTTRWLGQTLAIGEAARKAVKNIHVPLFAYQGGSDQLLRQQIDEQNVQSDAWEQFQKEIAAHGAVTLHPPSGNHMPFADPSTESQIRARLLLWLDRTAAKNSHE